MGGNVAGVDGSQGADKSIENMKEVFDRAIEKSSEITKIKTEKGVQLDAEKQRPNV